MVNKTPEEVMIEYTAQSEAVRRLFKTADGKITMALLDELFYDRSSVVEGDPYATHVNEGSRLVLLTLKEIIKDGDQ